MQPDGDQPAFQVLALTSCLTRPPFLADSLKALLPSALNAGLHDVRVIVVLGTELGSKGIVIVRRLNTMDLMPVPIRRLIMWVHSGPIRHGYGPRMYRLTRG
ncbi:hypothetical protein WS65_15705 [Burkholderia anthina]|nr:hypothetical protein WS65_15705 [Burkholderia anthina]